MDKLLQGFKIALLIASTGVYLYIIVYLMCGYMPF
jgi:hypothetical protein